MPIEVRQTEAFAAWFRSMRDTRARVQVRIDRLSLGNPGDVKPIGEGVSELRIDHGPGYRVYYTRRRQVVYLLLIGGDKGTQRQDITKAKALLQNLPKE